MIRKLITIAATTLGIGTLISAPSTVEAGPTAAINVSIEAAATATVTATPNVSASSWTGAALQLPFNVTVTTNDAKGYQFTFTGANAATGTAFTLEGSSANKVAPTYTVSGAFKGETYLYGVQNATSYPGPTPAGGSQSKFYVNLAALKNVPVDTYSDQLTVAVDPL